MKRIIALHGNPGHPDDWDILLNNLPEGFELSAIDANDDNWTKAVASSSEKKILIGHSWGCYRILKALPEIAEHIEKIILVAPYVRSERPLSVLAKILLVLPFIGDKLIQGSHKKTLPGFLEDVFYPLDTLDYLLKVRSRLSDWKNWKVTILNKIKMENHPLHGSDVVATPIVAIFGGADKISNKDFQSNFLKLFPNYQEFTVPEAGHGVLWTSPQILVQKIIETQNSKIGYHPGSDQRNNVIAYMEQHLQDFPDRVALRWANRESLAAWDGNPLHPIQHDEINYRNFSVRISSFAQGLLDIGITKGDRVIIFLPMSLDMYTAMFAAQRIGAIAVFLDSWARSHHLGASANCVSPKAMISFSMAFDLVDQVPEFKSMPIRILYGPGDKFTHKFETLLKQEISPIADVESEFSALITFTTGSTGTPKGANRTHRFLSAQHLALSHVIPYTAADRDMPAFPIFSLNNLASGVTTILPALNLAAPSERDSAILACQILNEKINCTTLSPSMLVGLAKYCKEKGIQLSGLRRVVTGGAPISKDDVKAFYEVAPQTELWILYGSTEAEPMAHIEGRDMLKESALLDPSIIEEGVNVGHISEDIDFKFIHIKDGPIDYSSTSWKELEVAPGDVGEFICTGDHVCRDYYNNTEAFKSTKIQDDQDRVWHRTGDLAYIDENKNLWIVGRTNNAIERAGKYYFPVRAEVLLKRLDFTHRCAFLGASDSELGQATYVAIELKSELDPKTFDFEKARAEINLIFNKNKIPVDYIKFVKQIPMDPRHHSKVEYKVLREQLGNPEVVIA